MSNFPLISDFQPQIDFVEDEKSTREFIAYQGFWEFIDEQIRKLLKKTKDFSRKIQTQRGVWEALENFVLAQIVNIFLMLSFRFFSLTDPAHRSEEN